jgi:hypothetical protein
MYISTTMLRSFKRGDGEIDMPFGYTLSKTPPNAEVESIEEWYTVYQENVWVNGEIIWRGRTIPRANVVPVPARRGDYLDLDGDRVFAEPYYYSPPSTASETERNRTR